MQQKNVYHRGVKRIFLSIAACWLVLCAGAFAQTDVGGVKESELPPAPQGYVLDDAGLFRERPEMLAEVQKSLMKLEQDTGYPVYLAIYYNVYEDGLQNRAEALRTAWMGEKAGGMVLVYQLDPVVGENPVSAYFKGSVLDRAENGEEVSGIISGQMLKAMLTKVKKEAKDKKENQAEYISAIIFGIEREIIDYNKETPASWMDSDNLKLMATFVGAIVGLALLGLLAWKLFSKSVARASKARHFPEIHVSQRLGAPYGGGWLSETRFVPSSSRE